MPYYSKCLICYYHISVFLLPTYYYYYYYKNQQTIHTEVVKIDILRYSK